MFVACSALRVPAAILQLLWGCRPCIWDEQPRVPLCRAVLCGIMKSTGSNLCNLLFNSFSLWKLLCPGVTGDVRLEIISKSSSAFAFLRAVTVSPSLPAKPFSCSDELCLPAASQSAPWEEVFLLSFLRKAWVWGQNESRCDIPGTSRQVLVIPKWLLRLWISCATAQNNLHAAECLVLCILNCISSALRCTFPEPNLYVFCNICGFTYLHYFTPRISEKELYQSSLSPAAACTQCGDVSRHHACCSSEQWGRAGFINTTNIGSRPCLLPSPRCAVQGQLGKMKWGINHSTAVALCSQEGFSICL